jgi:hypothetical protein
MASVEQTNSLYRRTLKENLKIRRYTGAGPNRPSFDTPCAGRVVGDRPAQLVGTANQYDFRVIVFVKSLIDNGFDPATLSSNDKLIYKGRELAISFPDDATRKEGDTLIAYELMVRG